MILGYVNKNDFDSCMDPSKPNQYFIQNQVQLQHHFDCDQDVTDRQVHPPPHRLISRFKPSSTNESDIKGYIQQNHVQMEEMFSPQSDQELSQDDSDDLHLFLETKVKFPSQLHDWTVIPAAAPYSLNAALFDISEYFHTASYFGPSLIYNHGNK